MKHIANKIVSEINIHKILVAKFKELILMTKDIC